MSKIYKITDDQTNEIMDLGFRFYSLGRLLELDRGGDDSMALETLYNKSPANVISNIARIIQESAECLIGKIDPAFFHQKEAPDTEPSTE